MGGYVKSLIGAKVATIGLQAASIALNAAISMGISLAISALVTQIQKWVNAQEDARKKSVELTNSYKEQQSSLESQIKKYKELKNTLDDGNLSTDEAHSIKEQLLEIQQSLIESYGDEASNIDLVNGKYREQLGLLGELSKEKATEYVTENRDVFADAKEALEKERTYNLGTVTSWNTYSPQTEDQKKLLDYIEAYSELLDLTHTGASGSGVTATSVSVSVKADVASADELMHQFATDLEKYGEENDIDVSGILEGISGQLKETWTDELTEYKTVYDEFMKAEIVRNDTLRPLYQESIQAVEDYNKALSTGEGIEEAKANLESIQQSVQSATGESEGLQSVFDGIYDGINKDAEAAYNLGKAFENDKIVQNYAEQLRGLDKVDLDNIRFDNDNTEKGEEAFRGLMETLGLTEEQVQSLINKLVELGYVQGEVQNQNPDETTIPMGILETVDALNTKLKPTMDSLKSAWQDVFNDDGEFIQDNVNLDMFTSIKSAIDELNDPKGLNLNINTSSYENLISVLNNAETTTQQAKDAFSSFATTIFHGVNASQLFNSKTKDTVVQMMESLGITNALEIANEQLASTEQSVALAEETKADALIMINSVDQEVIGSTQEKIQSYLLEAKASDVARIATLQAVLAEQEFAGTDLNCSEKINNLKELASAYLSVEQSARLSAFSKGLEKAGLSGDEVYSKQKEFIDRMSKESLKLNVEVDMQGLDSASKSAEKEIDIMAELNAELDEIQEGYEAVAEARETYEKYGKITVDQAQELVNTDLRLLATLGNEEDAYYSLANAKLEEMKIQLARNALDTINSLQTEADAVQYLAMANVNLRNQTLSANEALLQQAIIAKQGMGGAMADAASTIWQGYQNAVSMIGHVDAGFTIENSSNQKTVEDIFNEERRYLEHLQKMGEISNKEFYDKLLKLAQEYFGDKEEFKEQLWDVEEEVHDYIESITETYDWIENLLDSMAKKVNSLIDKADKFFSWQKKNAMINRAVKETDKQITQNQNAYNFYMAKANAVGLDREYVNKIQSGTLDMEELADEELSEKIEEYTDWYNKCQDLVDTMNELYDQERELIRQKLDNVIDYYNDIDSYLSSITSKVESLISLNDSMGKKSSLTELVNQFAEANDQLSTIYSKTTEITKTRTEIDFGESDLVNQAKKEKNQEAIDVVQAKINNLAITTETSGTYKKILDKIEKKEKEIQKYENKGWDVKKAKKYAKLQKQLEDFYELRTKLETNATSDTIANYNKIYTAFQKLQNKLDSGKTLKKGEQKKYDSYLEQMEQMRNSKDSILSELETELGILEGTVKDSTDEQKARKAIKDVQESLEDSAIYKNLEKTIEETEKKLAKLEEKGYDNLTKKQKKTYDKLTQQLEDYYEKKEAFDENATADNIAQYNKIYNAWKKLQDKLDAGKNLSSDQWKNYNKYTEQLAEFGSAKDAIMADLEDNLAEVLNPSDKLQTIDKEYEKAAEGIYNSYQKQIEGIRDVVTETEQYQNLLAKAQRLEQKKDTKGLSLDEQKKLDKYNAELEALRQGGTAENIADYISTWEKWYKLEKKLRKNGTLSGSDAKKYDEYTAKLKDWNKEKQTQINDLVSLMEDELESLQKTYTENVSQAESEINEYYANLYDLAKQIAEYNLSTLEAQLSLLDSYISYYQEIVSLYESFSGDKLAKILTDLDIGLQESQESLYAQYLGKLQEKYDATLSKINEYNELIEAIDTNDFASSMQVFQDAIEEYSANGQTEMASKLQSVLDLLDERSVDADNWGEFADEWLVEWEQALANAKSELVSTATSIQEVNDALREISFSNITDEVKELSNAQDILSSITGLINDDWLYDKDGNLTQHGLTKVGLLVEEMERAKQEASKYAELINAINTAKDTYSSESMYQDALQEAKMNYLTSLSDLQNYQDSIVSILTKADESIINSLKEVIEARKEALQKKKELYDYGKSLKTSQKEIDSIKAQIDALESLSDATDSATKAKLAQLKADLTEKEEALQETKDDHTYNLQIDALDEFMNTLDSTMTGVSESVSESFATYIEAINSAMKIYDANKDYLNNWSNDIIKTVTGLGSLGGNVGTDLNVSTEGSISDNEITVTSVSVVNSDTVNAVERTGAKTNENLGRIQELLQRATDDGILIRATNNPLLTMNPEMMRYLQNYIPPMATSVNHTIPNMIRERNMNPVVNIHYDTLMKVDGNVDRDFAKVFPDYLEKSCEYTKANIYAELRKLK